MSSSPATHFPDADPIVLMYHGVDPGDGRFRDYGGAARHYIISGETFWRHLQLLSKRNYQVVDPTARLEEEPARNPLKSGEIVFTFDDGLRSDYDVVYPMLRTIGWPGLFFVESGAVGKDGHLTAAMLREMAENGMVIGSHGHSHCFLAGLSLEKRREEIAGSKKRLEDILGKPVRALALPGGRMDAPAEATTREAGYQAVFTSRPERVFQKRGLWHIGRVPVRSDWTESRMADFLDRSEDEVAKLLRESAFRRHLQGLLGHRLYDRLHRLVWQIFEKK